VRRALVTTGVAAPFPSRGAPLSSAAVTPRRRLLAVVAIFLGVTLLYYASNPRLPDAYKHHVWVADAWLNGRLWVTGYPGHYHDWIKVDGEMHSPFAPTPAILLLPFVAWRGTDLNMNFFSMAVAGLNAALCWLLLVRVGVGPRRAALGTLVFAFGTVNWFTAIIGTTWFLSHLCVELFLLLALIEVFGKGRAALVGLLFGFAVLSRVNVVTSAPALLLLLVDRHATRESWVRFIDGAAFKRAILFGIGIAVPAALELWLNHTRFGSPFDTGYGKAAEMYLAGAPRSWYAWEYLPKHLYVSIFKGWEYQETFPYLKPSPEGLSILLTSPVLLYAFAAPWRESTVKLLWLAVGLIAAALFPYFYQGWVQFGYRYVLDALPYLIVLVALGMAGRRRAGVITVTELSMLANALGVYWGKKLGW
jgi:hypothetical protein